MICVIFITYIASFILLRKLYCIYCKELMIIIIVAIIVALLFAIYHYPR